MTVLFSAAAAYLGLKVGQVFEAAIPIAILAVGISGALGRKNALGENVIVQSVGACSGVVVAGAIFTLPAIYILGLDVNFWQMFFSSLLGGVLGILFLIPFRKYFVKEMHGKYPFPEATATTQVLVSGEGGGKSARILAVSGLIGGLYDFCIATFGLFTSGMEAFDKAVEEGIIYKVVTTNLCYQSPELLKRDYYISCEMSKYIAYLIDTLNHDASISDLLNPYDRIKKMVTRYNETDGRLSE